jgi:hydrogenase nickel incorporation protein HypB
MKQLLREVGEHVRFERTSAANSERTSVLRLEADILEQNDRRAELNRSWLSTRGIVALNLLSSPGSGKTTLLERTIFELRPKLRAELRKEVEISVIEGDQETSNDARRIRATGASVIQINTGAGCHLDSRMVGQALERLNPSRHSLVFIENVGNLVCPALFDLGEKSKVVILSVTEGDDKPLKYPHMFRAADTMILNKIDLLPYVRFDVDRCFSHAREVNPNIRMLQLSATRGDGMDAWYDWLISGRQLTC